MASTYWDDLTARKYIGEYKASFFGYSLLEPIRNNAASGGIVSTLLINAFREKKIDGALLCRSVIIDNAVVAEHFIARSEAEIIQSQGSKYITTKFSSNALPLIHEFKGNLAIVCLPCEARILHLMREKDRNLDTKIKLVITLFCGHVSNNKLTHLILNKLNPHNKPLKDFRYRIGHWRGNLKLEFMDGTFVHKPFNFFSDYQNLFFFSESKCLQCEDHTGSFSDISVGDVWSFKMKKNPIKHNAILVRSTTFISIIDQIQQNGLAHIYSVPVSEICIGQSRSLVLHASVNARMKAGVLFGIKINKVSEEKPSLLERMAAIIVLFNYWLSHRPLGEKIIPKIPRLVIKIYLFFFKALQVLQKPKRASRSIAIMGGSIWGNRGAESMLVTTLAYMRRKYPDVDFKVFSIYSQRDRSLIQDPKITIMSSHPLILGLVFFPFALMHWLFSHIGIKIWLPSQVRQLRDCAIMYDIGGITFAERGLVLLYNIFTILPAMMLGVPVIKLSQAVGPFISPANRFFAKLFLKRCQRIYSRGEISANYLRDLIFNPDQSPFIAADIAFLYKPEYSLSKENEDKVNGLTIILSKFQADGKTIIIISPSSVVLNKIGSPHYEQLILDAIINIDQRNYVYVFLPNSNRACSRKSQNNDIFVIEKIQILAKQNLPADLYNRIEWINWDLNSCSIREVFKYANLVVTSRFHAMISSLSLGIPVYVIGWSHKYQEVLRMFDLEDRFVSFQGVTLEILTEGIKYTLHNNKFIKEKIQKHLPSVMESSKTQFIHENITFD